MTDMDNVTALFGLRNNLTVNNTTIHSSSTGEISILLKVNADVASKLLPVTVLLWFYLIIGTFGNVLVIIVYLTQKKPVREGRYLIPFLALSDLASCIVSAGSGIFAQMYPLMFNNNVGCKTAAFLGITFAGLSSYMLVLIAVERYLKVCRPFGRQVTLKVKQITMVVLLAVSIFLAGPAIWMYASQQIPMKVKPDFVIQTWKCQDVQNNNNANSSLAYKVVISIAAFLMLLALLLCYGNVVRVIVRQGKHRLRLRSFLSTTGSVSNNHVLEDPNEKKNLRQNCDENVNDKIKGDNINTNPTVEETPRKASVSEQLTHKRKQSLESVSNSCKRRGSTVSKLSIMFAVITLIYFVTHIPKAVLMIAQTKDDKFWSRIPLDQLGFYRFLHTFFIFNNIINPFIYVIMDRHFREECKKILSMRR